MTGKRETIVFWLSNANPYWSERFSALEASGRVPFEVWFNGRSDSQRKWTITDDSLRFPHRFLQTVRLPGPKTVAGDLENPRRVFHVACPLGALRSVRPRALVTFHGDPALALAMPLARATRTPLVYYAEASAKVAFGGRLRGIVKRVMFSQAHAFLTPGDDATARLERQGVRRLKVQPLHHVVDVESLGPRSESACEPNMAPCQFLYVGRLAKAKGLHELLAATDLLEARGIPFRLTLVGESTSRANHEDLLARRPNCRWIPFVPRTSLRPVFADADVFVFPSHADTYGLVVDEAMACGLPVVASDVVGEIHERVRPGSTGVLVPDGDVTALADAMAAYALDPTRARDEGRLAQEFMAARGLDLWVDDVARFAETLP